MKKMMTIVFALTCVFGLMIGCEEQADQEKEVPKNKQTQEEKAPTEQTENLQIANPWTDWNSIAEAEDEVGFVFGLPETVADTYTADVIRTMNGQLIEVLYCYEDYEVCVRKKKGENKDVSGDYNQYENRSETKRDGGTVIHYYNSDNDAEKQIISYQGYSWSLVASNGYERDSGEAFLNFIFR